MELFSSKHAFIQKDPSNQVVTELKEAYQDLYDAIVNKYQESLPDEPIETDEQFLKASYKHLSFNEALRALEDSFLRTESALDA